MEKWPPMFGLGAARPCGQIAAKQTGLGTMGLKFTSISYPGAYSTQLNGINNAGEVAGSYAISIFANAAQQAFTEAGGSFSDITGILRARHQVGGINNAGKVAITAGGGTTVMEALVWSPNGTTTTIIDQGGLQAHAYDVNDPGVVVGSVRSFSSGMSVAFVYQHGALNTFTVGGLNTEAHGINNTGTIVGVTTTAPDATGDQGFIDRGGVITALNVPGAVATDPLDINNQGDVAGSFYDGTHWHGFIEDAKGHMTFIDDPDAAGGDTWVTGIDDHGDVTGRHRRAVADSGVHR
jgi:hypothetical protein